MIFLFPLPWQIAEGLWVNPGVPEMMQQAEQKSLLHTYGKFWNFWQFDRGMCASPMVF